MTRDDIIETALQCGVWIPMAQGQEREQTIDRLQCLVGRAVAAERIRGEARYARAIRILAGIHAMLYPPRFTDNDGRTWQFKSPIAEEQLQELSDRIRAIPDELDAIDAADRARLLP